MFHIKLRKKKINLTYQVKIKNIAALNNYSLEYSPWSKLYLIINYSRIFLQKQLLLNVKNEHLNNFFSFLLEALK